MSKEIFYNTAEGQDFQGKPHVSLMPSLEFDGTWRVDLRWREDTTSSAIDAQFNFVDGIDFESALAEAFDYGITLNIPVARYEEESIQVLREQGGQSNKEQDDKLQFLIHCDNAQRFPTH